MVGATSQQIRKRVLRVSEEKVTVSPDESFTVLSIDAEVLRSLGLVSVLDRLSGGKKLSLPSLAQAKAKRGPGADGYHSLVIYDIGGASVADPKHQKRIKALRLSTAEGPLVILSDHDSRDEIIGALNLGAQGFLCAGIDVQLALQALAFISKGGSYFPALQPERHPTQPHEATDGTSPSAVVLDGNGAMQDAVGAGSTLTSLTERQRTVLERVSRGDSNKIIARGLGIKEGTVKFHVRQLMRKLGVANRTQIAIACATGTGAETREGAGIRGR
jgi:DNA-binding NarL/FixJ family response regulator